MARFSPRVFAVSALLTLAVGAGAIAYRELQKPDSPIPDLTGLEPIKIACVDLTDRVRGREAVREYFRISDGYGVTRFSILGHTYFYVIANMEYGHIVLDVFVDATGDGDFQQLANADYPPVPAWVLANADKLRGQRIEEHCVVKYENGAQ